MRKLSQISMLLIIIFSCSNNVKEYYENGNLKKEYKLVNGKIDGEFKEYYRNGNMKAVHLYAHGKPNDSAIYFYNNKSNTINQIIKPINDSLQRVIAFDSLENQKYEGNLHNENERIGIWKFYQKEYDSIVEYMRIKGKPFTNQVWVVDKKKDTLPFKSNFFSMLVSDSIKKEEYLKINILLAEPYFNDESEMKVLLPKKGYAFNSDFSNIDEIELDTIPSFKNYGVNPANYPDNYPLNHATNPALIFDDEGLITIRGAIVEYVTNKKGKKFERWLYFEKDVYVKNTL